MALKMNILKVKTFTLNVLTHSLEVEADIEEMSEKEYYLWLEKYKEVLLYICKLLIFHSILGKVLSGTRPILWFICEMWNILELLKISTSFFISGFLRAKPCNCLESECQQR
jgi:hypothetical protein